MITLAGADSPGEHLQLAAFTAVAAAFFIWVGRKQRRTGRGAFMPDSTVRAADLLIPPLPPRRGQRVAGCAYIVFGGLFVLAAVVNTGMAISELLT